MSKNMICLNCESPTSGKYCSNCGQKTDTHRITAKHFFTHDLVHGVWHIEKGILFTLKEALIRPGKAGLDYIKGKRIRYYNIFYLTLLLVGLMIFVTGIYDKLYLHDFKASPILERNEAGKSMDKFISDYSKLIIFSFIPLFALNSLVVFRSKKLNLSEHLVIAGMMFLGVITISLVGELLYFTVFLRYIDFIAILTNFAVPVTILFYVLINYYRTFKDDYKTIQILFRTFLFLIMIIIEIIIMRFLIIGYFTNWTYELS